MKQIYFLAALLCTLQGLTQDAKMPRNNLNQVEYSEVVKLDSIASTQLFFNSNSFINTAFHDARNTAQLKDEKTKTIATKGSIPVTVEVANGETITLKTLFTLILQCKDEYYKYTLKDFYFAYTEETGVTVYTSFNDRIGIGMTKKQWAEIETQTDAFVKSFIESLKEKMLEKTLGSQVYVDVKKSRRSK